MLRLSKQTDYGIVLLTAMANGDTEGASHSARELSQLTRLPLPMVGKILKVLAREGILVSQRGMHGGYSLARRPEDLSLVEILNAIEGPLALTECSGPSSSCEHEENCPVQVNWVSINRVIQDALGEISLRDMAQPTLGLVQLAGGTEGSTRL